MSATALRAAASSALQLNPAVHAVALATAGLNHEVAKLHPAAAAAVATEAVVGDVAAANGAARNCALVAAAPAVAGPCMSAGPRDVG